jgi:hypothetical protein
LFTCLLVFQDVYDTRSEKMVEIMDKTEKAIGEVSLTQLTVNEI